MLGIGKAKEVFLLGWVCFVESQGEGSCLGVFIKGGSDYSLQSYIVARFENERRQKTLPRANKRLFGNQHLLEGIIGQSIYIISANVLSDAEEL